jgi:Ser/Thr protein kinase RdoA (MazF antagonist)
MLRDEQAGLAFCNKLGMRSVSSPDAHFSSDPPALWVAKAPGETPGSLITRYDRREIPAEDVYDALFAVGNFLHELHNRFRQPFDDKARDLLEVYIEHHEAILERADPLELQERAVQDAVQIFRQESAYLRRNGLHCALLHGDANCGNFLWDAATKHLSVIDLQRLGTQIRKEARGFAAFEYRSLLNVLDYYPNIAGLRGGLDLARDAFEAGYGDVNEQEDRFFTAIRFIRRSLAGNERIHQITRPPVPI